MTMAKRCRDCGKSFYPSDDRVVCQDCAGDAPNDADQRAADWANVQKANSAPQTDTQTVDIKTLTNDGAAQTVNPRRGRKKKDADDAG
nr:MAG TPA: RRN7 Zinc-finger of RNA-polymerase I-specific TFIIB, Rrn7 [Caudoviricetes sp.]